MNRNDRPTRQNSRKSDQGIPKLVLAPRQNEMGPGLEASFHLPLRANILITRRVWDQCIADEPRDPVTPLRKDESERLELVIWALVQVLPQLNGGQVHFLPPLTSRHCKPLICYCSRAPEGGIKICVTIRNEVPSGDERPPAIYEHLHSVIAITKPRTSTNSDQRICDIVLKIPRQKKPSTGLEFSVSWRARTTILLTRGVWDQCIADEPGEPATPLRKDEFGRLGAVFCAFVKAMDQTDGGPARFLSPITNRHCEPVMLECRSLGDFDFGILLRDEEPFGAEKVPASPANPPA